MKSGHGNFESFQRLIGFCCRIQSGCTGYWLCQSVAHATTKVEYGKCRRTDRVLEQGGFRLRKAGHGLFDALRCMHQGLRKRPFSA